MSIRNRIEKLENEIPTDVKLIAVSKTRSLDEIEEAYLTGIRDFGENKVQELVDKYEEFHKDVKWHFIGHLQRNKVKYIVGKVFLIHSLDNILLLNEIEKKYSLVGEIANVLIQINIGRDENKSGVFIEALEELIYACEECRNVKVLGLMTVLPKGDESSNRKYFKEMNEIFDNLKIKNYKNISMKYLSMGMSGDYKTALEEGANVIRIGEGIFGKRNYNNI